MTKEKTLLPHQQRVVQECAELRERLGKLSLFIGTPLYSALDSAERDRLARQQRLMWEYAEVLDERIAAFSI